MESSLTSQKRIYDRCAEYIRYLDECGSMTQRNDISEFWAKIFQEKQRLNDPEFNDMLLKMRDSVRATRHSKTRHLTPFDGLMLESTGIK